MCFIFAGSKHISHRLGDLGEYGERVIRRGFVYGNGSHAFIHLFICCHSSGLVLYTFSLLFFFSLPQSCHIRNSEKGTGRRHFASMNLLPDLWVRFHSTNCIRNHTFCFFFCVWFFSCFYFESTFIANGHSSLLSPSLP